MKKANSLFLNLYTNTIMCGLDNSFVWPSFPSSIQQEMGQGVSTSFLLKHVKFLSYKTPKINGQEEIQTKQWPHQTWRLEQVPHALSHLEFLMYTFLQDFGSLAILHLHFPPLCQDPGFLIGQGIPELLGDLCFLLFPSKRPAAWVSLGEKLEDHITAQL